MNHSKVGKIANLKMVLRSGKIHIPVTILEQKTKQKAFGKERYLVRPLWGRGKIWVLASNCKMQRSPKAHTEL